MSNKTIEGNTILKTVDGSGINVNIDSGSIDHDATLNYDADEHIDWTNTTEDFKTSSSVTIDGDNPYQISNVSSPISNEYLFESGNELLDTVGTSNLSVVGSPAPVFGSHLGRPSVSDFSATNSYLQSSITIGDNDFDIEFYFNKTGDGRLLSFVNVGSTEFWTVIISGSKINFLRETSFGAGDALGFTSDNTFADGVWYKVKLECTSVSVNLIVDDVVEPFTFYTSNGAGSTARVPVACDTFRIASDLAGNNSDNVYIDDITIFNITESIQITGEAIYADKQTFSSSINIPTGSNSGYVLQSDSFGDASWQNPVSSVSREPLKICGSLNAENQSAGISMSVQNVFYQCPFETADISQNITASAVSNDITILTAGLYYISFCGSYEGSSSQLDFELHLNGARNFTLHSGSTASSSGAYTATCFAGILNLSVNDTLDVRVRNNTVGSQVIRLRDANFAVFKI